MTEPIRFTKMHGAGNDYIYVNTMAFPVRNPEELAIRLSAPHTGIGSDGLVLIGSSKIADFSMRIFNADGSEAMMCGNASRCIGKYVYDKRLTNKKNITLETLSGIKELQLTTRKLSGPHEEVTEVTVDMGCPVIGATAVASAVRGKTGRKTKVVMDGGPLTIHWDESSGHVYMTGGAVKVFEGELEI